MIPDRFRTNATFKMVAAALLVAMALPMAGCGVAQDLASTANGLINGSSAKTSTEAKDTVNKFATAWLDDWTFSGGAMHKSQLSVFERCSPYMAKDSLLYRDMSDESNFNNPRGKFWRGAMLNVVSVDVKSENDNIYRVVAQVYGVQNDVTQEMYDNMRSDPSKLHTYTMLVTVDNSGKVNDMEQLGMS